MSCRSSHAHPWPAGTNRQLAHPWPAGTNRQLAAPLLVYVVVLICMGYLVQLGYEAMSAISITVVAGLGAAEIVRRLGVAAA